MRLIKSVATACVLLMGATACQQERNDQTSEVPENDLVANESFTAEPVVNESMRDFDSWDLDADQRWTRDEFIAGTVERGIFSDWDTERDDRYSQDEIAYGLFNNLDKNSDGFLTKEELASASTTLGNSLHEQDMNNDERLDRSEFYSGVIDSGLYKKWDVNKDGTLSSEELNNTLFDTWDVNRDNYLDKDEINNSDYDVWSRKRPNTGAATEANKE